MFLGTDIRPTLTVNSVNIHNQWMELRENLALVALGGSCASYLKKSGEDTMSSIYQAYPYLNDALFTHDLKALLAKVDSS